MPHTILWFSFASTLSHLLILIRTSHLEDSYWFSTGHFAFDNFDRVAFTVTMPSMSLAFTLSLTSRFSSQAGLRTTLLDIDKTKMIVINHRIIFFALTLGPRSAHWSVFGGRQVDNRSWNCPPLLTQQVVQLISSSSFRVCVLNVLIHRSESTCSTLRSSGALYWKRKTVQLL